MIGQDLFVAPGLDFNDGRFYIAFIKEGVTKVELLKILINAGDGQFLNNPSIEYVAVKAFRLEPLSFNHNANLVGNLMIDGESVDYGSIQGETSPSMGQILLRK